MENAIDVMYNDMNERKEKWKRVRVDNKHLSHLSLCW